MIGRIKIVLVGLIILSILFSASCITINQAPKTTSTTTQSVGRTEGLVPIQNFVASPDYNPAVDITQLVQVQNQIDQLFKQRYDIPYYEGLPELSKLYEPHDFNQLQMALKDLRSITQWTYVANRFDCSNMSALTQFYLANAGFNAVMVVGQDPNNYDGHAWGVVLLSNPTPQAIPIECTTPGGPSIPSEDEAWSYTSRGVTGTQTYSDYITSGWTVQNIYQAVAWSKENFGETLGADNDFNWWDTTQINWSLLHMTTTTQSSSVSTISTTPLIPSISPGIAVNPQSASTGAIVTITGQGFTPNGVIPALGIQVGGLIGNAGSIPIDANGGFSYSFTLSGLENGAYTVVAADSSTKQASCNFTCVILTAITSIASTTTSGTAAPDHPLMNFTPEQLSALDSAYENAPTAAIRPQANGAPLPTTFSLLPDLDYNPVQRNQGNVGNCWVWAGTGIMEIALDVDNSIKDRLSIQYFDSNYNGGSGPNWAGDATRVKVN